MSVKLRTDFDAPVLRSLARQSRDANQARRLLALALVYDGKSRTEAANTGGVGLQILRDWILRFNADGPDGLKDRWHKGPEPKLNDEQRLRLIQMIEDGPIPAVHGVVRWRIVDLAGWLFDEFGVSISKSRLSRIVNDLGYRKLSARPKHHGPNEMAQEAFKKTSTPTWQRSSAAFRSEPSSKSGGRTRPE